MGVTWSIDILCDFSFLNIDGCKWTFSRFEPYHA